MKIWCYFYFKSFFMIGFYVYNLCIIFISFVIKCELLILVLYIFFKYMLWLFFLFWINIVIGNLMLIILVRLKSFYIRYNVIFEWCYKYWNVLKFVMNLFIIFVFWIILFIFGFFMNINIWKVELINVIWYIVVFNYFFKFWFIINIK